MRFKLIEQVFDFINKFALVLIIPLIYEYNVSIKIYASMHHL